VQPVKESHNALDSMIPTEKRWTGIVPSKNYHRGFLLLLLLRGPSAYCPGCTAALGLLCSPKFPFQYRFSSLMPLMKRQRSLTVNACITLGSTTESPKTLNRQRAIALQRQMMCCTVSASCPQNLQTGSPSNRCVLTGACHMRIATTILS
jgi:hypothetical protein